MFSFIAHDDPEVLNNANYTFLFITADGMIDRACVVSETSDSAAKSTAGFTQISDGVISMCHLLETSTMSPSDKDSWNVAWSHWANPGACQHLWGC